MQEMRLTSSEGHSGHWMLTRGSPIPIIGALLASYRPPPHSEELAAHLR